MKDKLVEEVLKLRELEDSFTTQIKELEEKYIAQPKVALQTVRDELDRAHQSLLESMKKDSIKTYSYKDTNVTMSVRRTLTITNESVLSEYITMNTARIGKAIGLKIKDIKDKAFLKVLNKPYARELADSFLKVEGKPLLGTELKETEYITIK